MDGIGTVHQDSKNVYQYTWKIKRFSEIEDACYFGVHCYLKGPRILFAGATWYLRYYPQSLETDKMVHISLHKQSFSPPITLNYSLGIKNLSGKIDHETHCRRLFDMEDEGFNRRYSLELSKSLLLNRKSQLLPRDVLTVVLTMELPHDMKEASTGNFFMDLERMLLFGEHSDMTVKVKGKEFKLHKNILSVRNQYFRTMFEVEMKEKLTDTVFIDDCEPDIFNLFIRFLYTGKADEITVGNVCELFEVADKYLAGELKKICLNFMMYSISLDSFFDYTVLASRYGEKDLQTHTEEFFCYYGGRIKQKSKWQIFVNEYPEEVNNLSIKFPWRFLDPSDPDYYSDTSYESDDS